MYSVFELYIASSWALSLPLQEAELELAYEVHELVSHDHVHLFLGVLDDLGLLLVVEGHSVLDELMDVRGELLQLRGVPIQLFHAEFGQRGSQRSCGDP